MIPVSVFNILLAAAILMFLYSVIDYKHNFYVNVAFSFVAGFILMYLSVIAASGAVYDSSSCSLAVNNTSVTPYGCTVHSAFTDRSLGLILQFVAVVCWVYSLVMAALIYITYRKDKSDKEKAMQMQRRGY